MYIYILFEEAWDAHEAFWKANTIACKVELEAVYGHMLNMQQKYNVYNVQCIRTQCEVIGYRRSI